jgi:hypothetical protein
LTDTDLEGIRRRDRNRLGLRQSIVVFLTVRAGDQASVAAHAWIFDEDKSVAGREAGCNQQPRSMREEIDKWR